MKKAFTLLELVFVIMVVGVLSAILITRTERSPLQEAAVQLLSDIRYTQHLAIIDDKFNALDPDWYQRRWQILFGKNVDSNNQWAYTIFSDTAGHATGDASEAEIAINPMNLNQRMTGGYTGANNLNYSNSNFVGMKKLNLGSSFGIDDITFTCGQRLAFDHIGRPMRGDQSTMTGSYHAGTDRLLKNKCTIVLKKGTKEAKITIMPETGYVRITF
ncbi:type II secretion system protein [Sulfurimonas sp.]|uniref:pilus assembly FimT family protein n=1 Tax=Sulfurimonas sp. TaxID=2022749 RepID=UPI00260187E9|nr:type II secretion system protein [Sulfurimonas sp.]